MAEVKVWVVSVSFRSARLMIDCLRSIEKELSTPRVKLGAIVVDNASGDFPILSQAVQENGWSSWVKLILAPKNGGFAYGSNLGIQLAMDNGDADYIFLLNPDTQVRRHAIGSLIAFLESHRNVAIAGPSFEKLDGKGWPIAFRFPSIATELSAALGIGLVTKLLGDRTVEMRMAPVAQQVDWISGAAMMIRSDVFKTIGGLDENYFLYFEETDFCFRARKAGFSTWYVPESRVMHIMGQSTDVVIEGCSRPKRLPAYWFESRRRYLASSLGPRAAMAVDLVVLLTYPIGYLKQVLLGRGRTLVSHYLRDVWRHSILRRRNRRLAPCRTHLPNPSPESDPVALVASGRRRSA